MLTKLTNAIGLRIEATDGAIGEVHDFYFDEETWTIRYMVADTRRWLPGKRVLIVPEAFGDLNPAVRHFAVNLTRDQVRESPDYAEDLPVSRQWEIDLHGYYGWTPYWELTSTGSWPMTLVAPTPDPAEDEIPAAHERGDPHLRSAREVTGYHVAATDGKVGHVADFVAATDSWKILYLVVDTRKWLPGRTVLLPADWIDEVEWAEHEVVTHLQSQRIKESPDFDPADPINRDYEAQLYEHYGRKPYWLA